jgi:hypothetical protein
MYAELEFSGEEPVVAVPGVHESGTILSILVEGTKEAASTLHSLLERSKKK